MNRVANLVAITVLAATAPAAQAGELNLAAGGLTYTGATGETNQVTVWSAETLFMAAGTPEFQVTEEGADIVISAAARSAGCKYEEEWFDDPPDTINDRRKVRCPAPASVTVALGDADDTLSHQLAIPATATGGDGADQIIGAQAAAGGSGDDRLWGSDAGDHLAGDGGSDSLRGLGGNDTLDGGDGDDRLDTDLALSNRSDQAGADTYLGGPGTDQLSYNLRSAALTVTLDGQPDDGAAGEGDNVGGDLEAIVGGFGNDKIVGDDDPERLAGQAGGDTIISAGGADVIFGDAGDDLIDSGSGDDMVDGGHGGDAIDAGRGADKVESDPLCESFVADCGGADTIRVRDGERDSVVCGVREDTVFADGLDTVGRDGPQGCERVNPDLGPGKLVGAPRKLSRKKLAKSGVALTVSCEGPCLVQAELVVSKAIAKQLGLKGRTLGRVKRQLTAGASQKVVVPVARKAKKRLRALAEKFELQVVGSIEADGGTTKFKKAVKVV